MEPLVIRVLAAEVVLWMLLGLAEPVGGSGGRVFLLVDDVGRVTTLREAYEELARLPKPIWCEIASTGDSLLPGVQCYGGLHLKGRMAVRATAGLSAFWLKTLGVSDAGIGAGDKVMVVRGVERREVLLDVWLCLQKEYALPLSYATRSGEPERMSAPLATIEVTSLDSGGVAPASGE